MLQGWAFLMGGTFFALVFRPWRMNYVPNAAGIAGIAAVVLIGNVLAFSCYMSGVKYIGPQKSSLFSFAEPVTAPIISNGRTMVPIRYISEELGANVIWVPSTKTVAIAR